MFQYLCGVSLNEQCSRPLSIALVREKQGLLEGRQLLKSVRNSSVCVHVNHPLSDAIILFAVRICSRRRRSLAGDQVVFRQKEGI